MYANFLITIAESNFMERINVIYLCENMCHQEVKGY